MGVRETVESEMRETSRAGFTVLLDQWAHWCCILHVWNSIANRRQDGLVKGVTQSSSGPPQHGSKKAKLGRLESHYIMKGLPERHYGGITELVCDLLRPFYSDCLSNCAE